jgi:hypothetical protein
MVAEERITTKFTGLVAAHGSEEEATFLSTQQVDEARHMQLESTLGLTSFKFITDYLTAERLLPGFVEGYSKIHHDETRHIGDGNGSADLLGVTQEEIREFALGGLTRRLELIGVPLETVFS